MEHTIAAQEVRPSAVLLGYTPAPEAAVARAARLCYAPRGLDDPALEMTLEEARQFVEKLRGMGHLSPFEHASFQFYLTGSRAMLAQLTRHRLASYSVQSLRYVTPEQAEFVVPPSVRRKAELYRIYREEMLAAFRVYREMVELGAPPEDARMVLGQGVATRLICTFNARSLRNFFALRCCRRAQWEIRQIAWQMRRLVIEAAPSLFADSGPACEAEGRCHEGRFSCGRHRVLSRPAAPRDTATGPGQLLDSESGR